MLKIRLGPSNSPFSPSPLSRSKPIKRPAHAIQHKHHIRHTHRLAVRQFHDGTNVLQQRFQSFAKDESRLVVNGRLNAFDAAAAREAADVAFRNALKVVAKDLSVFWGDVLLDFSCFFDVCIYMYI